MGRGTERRFGTAVYERSAQRLGIEDDPESPRVLATRGRNVDG